MRTKFNAVIAVIYMTTFKEHFYQVSLSTGKLYDKKNIYTPLFIQLNMSYLQLMEYFKIIFIVYYIGKMKDEKKNNIGKSDNGLRKLK